MLNCGTHWGHALVDKMSKPSFLALSLGLAACGYIMLAYVRVPFWFFAVGVFIGLVRGL